MFQGDSATVGKTLVPLRADAARHYTFVLRQTLREQDRELAVIDFAWRPGAGPGLRGTLYIDPRTAAVFRIEQEMPVNSASFSNPSYRVEHMLLQLTTDFVTQDDSTTRVASVRNGMTVDATVKGFADQTVISSYFLVYEYGPPAPGRKYPDTDPALVDLAQIKKRRYNPQLWLDNAVIKASPIEESIIQDFEGQRVFGKLQ